MEVEGEPAIGEAEVKTEATRAEKALTITSTSEEVIDGLDTETTARRCNLGNMTHPKNLLQAVEGARKTATKAQWTGWTRCCAL